MKHWLTTVPKRAFPRTWGDVDPESPAVAYLLTLAPTGRRTQAKALEHAAAAFGARVGDVSWETVQPEQVRALRTWIAGRFAPSTANRILVAVRRVLLICVRRGTMTREAYDRCHVERIRGSRVAPGRSLAAHELARLFDRAAAIGGLVGARQAAMVALLYGGGLRRAEVVGLDLADVEAAGASVLAHGKGNKERRVPLPEGAQRALQRWLALRGSEAGPLLCAIRGARAAPVLDVSTRLDTATVYTTCARLARSCGLAAFSPHDLRRTYIGDLLDAGVDLATVQALAGHEDPITTSRYDRRPARARADAVQRLRVPFSR